MSVQLKMSQLKVFADLMSQPSRAVVIFCNVTKIQFEFRQLRIAKLEHKTPGQSRTVLKPSWALGKT